MCCDILCIGMHEVVNLHPVAIDTLGGKRNLKMKIKAQQMTFKQDITKIIIHFIFLLCLL